MRMIYALGSALLALTVAEARAAPILVDLGTASSFAVLAGSTVTNTGATEIGGNLGVWPGTAITGFPPGILSPGVFHAGEAVAMAAQSDLTTAYNFAAGQACGTNLSGQDLGGSVLTSGVYCFSSSAELTGTLTLDGQGDPNAAFIFQIASSLVSASNAAIAFTNGAQGDGLFFQVGSSATLGTGTLFAGNILALTSITLNTGAEIACGRALARNGAVTLDSNVVSNGGDNCGRDITVVPEPASAALLASALLLLAGVRRASAKRK